MSAVNYLSLALMMLVVFNVLQRRHQQDLDKSYDEIRQRISSLRLSKMLSYLHADVDEYMCRVPVENINQQINVCSRCMSHELCDACLRDGKIIHDMNFCPNYRSLMEQSKTIAQRRR